MNDRATGQGPGRVTAVLGPTNTGKTHLAVERMLGHATGMIGLPLRLLAREVYERIVRQRGAASVALITGEEKIVPDRPRYWVSTVEAMSLDKTVDFLAVDEIQLIADPERGHVFTRALLHARGRHDTMFLGAGTAAPLIRRLVPDVEIVTRDRLSTLSYAGSRKLTRLPRRSAVVAFSTDQVYAIAELIRRQRGGAAVVMGSLSPRTRNAQVELFQSGEVDFLVATDAIGMGLNMDVDHVAFAGLRKFDGRRTRWLHAHEIGQIAGRAGRHLRDGTFGVTGECEDLDADLVEQVVEHQFDPLEAAEWRNARLDFDTLPDLLRSLEQGPGRPGLRLTAPALDEVLLRRAAHDEDVRRIARSRGALMRLWEACQLPDFQKTTPDEHARLAKEIFQALTGRGPFKGGRLTEDWFAPRFADLDRTDGQIDQLSARLSGVRTLAYIAARPDWLERPQGWRDQARVLEERLSDVLHERLIARFVDRRTTALMRALNDRDLAVAAVDDAGGVTVEGETVGRLEGVAFRPEVAGTRLEARALSAAARKAVAPEVARRLGELAADADEAFALTPEGVVLWRGAAAARVVAAGDLFDPRARLIGDLGAEPARERARRRIEAWLAAEGGRRMRPLHRLRRAVETGVLKGLVRGLAFRLVEAGGVLDRREVEGDLAALSQSERRAVKAFAIRVGAHSVWLPGLTHPRALAFAQGLTAPLPETAPRRLAALGVRDVGGVAVPVASLERLPAPDRRGRVTPPEDAAVLVELGWTVEVARAIAQGLSRRPPPDRAQRGRADPAASPFAVLAALPAPAAAPAKRRRRRRPVRKVAS